MKDLTLMETIVRIDKLSQVLDSVNKDYDKGEQYIKYSFVFEEEEYNFYIQDRFNDNRFDHDNLYCWYETINENGDVDDYFSLDYLKFIVDELYKICLEKDLIK